MRRKLGERRPRYLSNNGLKQIAVVLVFYWIVLFGRGDDFFNFSGYAKKNFCDGDIHDAHKALVQCIQRSGFDYQYDILIQLGDIVDGHNEVLECVEELLKIKHLIAVKGNHDVWFKEFIDSDYHPVGWRYGGEGTIASYLRNVRPDGVIIRKGDALKTSLSASDIPLSHRKLFSDQMLYHIDNRNRLFVHAGFNAKLPFEGQQESTYYFDRDLWTDAMHKSRSRGDFEQEKIGGFENIFIGHTATTYWETDLPMQALNITNLDT